MNYTTLTAYLLGEASGPLTGIYLITNKNTGLRYVGQSVNIKKRWKDHLSGLIHGKRRTHKGYRLAREVS